MNVEDTPTYELFDIYEQMLDEQREDENLFIKVRDELIARGNLIAR